MAGLFHLDQTKGLNEVRNDARFVSI